MSTKKKKVNKAVAITTLRAPGKMSPELRKSIAEWMRAQAKDLVKQGDKYTTGRFTARYFQC